MLFKNATIATMTNQGSYGLIECGALYIRDGKIDWKEPAENIHKLVRALTYPYPGAYFYSQRKKWVIEEAQVISRGPTESKMPRRLFGRKAR
mgnify:CR=1 FL=1